VFTRRTWVSLLLLLNVLLAVGLLSSALSLPRALGQGAGRGGSYLSVTARATGETYDVLYILDLSTNKLHAFYPNPTQAKQLTRSEPRDLHLDFGKQP